MAAPASPAREILKWGRMGTSFRPHRLQDPVPVPPRGRILARIDQIRQDLLTSVAEDPSASLSVRWTRLRRSSYPGARRSGSPVGPPWAPGGRRTLVATEDHH